MHAKAHAGLSVCPMAMSNLRSCLFQALYALQSSADQSCMPPLAPSLLPPIDGQAIIFCFIGTCVGTLQFLRCLVHDAETQIKCRRLKELIHSAIVHRILFDFELHWVGAG